MGQAPSSPDFRAYAYESYPTPGDKDRLAPPAQADTLKEGRFSLRNRRRANSQPSRTVISAPIGPLKHVDGAGGPGSSVFGVTVSDVARQRSKRRGPEVGGAVDAMEEIHDAGDEARSPAAEGRHSLSGAILRPFATAEPSRAYSSFGFRPGISPFERDSRFQNASNVFASVQGQHRPWADDENGHASAWRSEGENKRATASAGGVSVGRMRALRLKLASHAKEQGKEGGRTRTSTAANGDDALPFPDTAGDGQPRIHKAALASMDTLVSPDGAPSSLAAASVSSLGYRHPRTKSRAKASSTFSFTSSSTAHPRAVSAPIVDASKKSVRARSCTAAQVAPEAKNEEQKEHGKRRGNRLRRPASRRPPSAIAEGRNRPATQEAGRQDEAHRWNEYLARMTGRAQANEGRDVVARPHSDGCPAGVLTPESFQRPRRMPHKSIPQWLGSVQGRTGQDGGHVVHSMTCRTLDSFRSHSDAGEDGGEPDDDERWVDVRRRDEQDDHDHDHDQQADASTPTSRTRRSLLPALDLSAAGPLGSKIFDGISSSPVSSPRRKSGAGGTPRRRRARSASPADTPGRKPSPPCELEEWMLLAGQQARFASQGEDRRTSVFVPSLLDVPILPFVAAALAGTDGMTDTVTSTKSDDLSPAEDPPVGPVPPPRPKWRRGNSSSSINSLSHAAAGVKAQALAQTQALRLIAHDRHSLSTIASSRNASRQGSSNDIVDQSLSTTAASTITSSAQRTTLAQYGLGSDFNVGGRGPLRVVNGTDGEGCPSPAEPVIQTTASQSIFGSQSGRTMNTVTSGTASGASTLAMSRNSSYSAAPDLLNWNDETAASVETSAQDGHDGNHLSPPTTSRSLSASSRGRRSNASTRPSAASATQPSAGKGSRVRRKPVPLFEEGQKDKNAAAQPGTGVLALSDYPPTDIEQPPVTTIHPSTTPTSPISSVSIPPPLSPPPAQASPPPQLRSPSRKSRPLPVPPTSSARGPASHYKVSAPPPLPSSTPWLFVNEGLQPKPLSPVPASPKSSAGSAGKDIDGKDGNATVAAAKGGRSEDEDEASSDLFPAPPTRSDTSNGGRSRPTSGHGPLAHVEAGLNAYFDALVSGRAQSPLGKGAARRDGRLDVRPTARGQTTEAAPSARRSLAISAGSEEDEEEEPPEEVQVVVPQSVAVLGYAMPVMETFGQRRRSAKEEEREEALRRERDKQEKATWERARKKSLGSREDAIEAIRADMEARGEDGGSRLAFGLHGRQPAGVFFHPFHPDHPSLSVPDIPAMRAMPSIPTELNLASSSPSAFFVNAGKTALPPPPRSRKRSNSTTKQRSVSSPGQKSEGRSGQKRRSRSERSRARRHSEPRTNSSSTTGSHRGSSSGFGDSAEEGGRDATESSGSATKTTYPGHPSGRRRPSAHIRSPASHGTSIPSPAPPKLPNMSSLPPSSSFPLSSQRGENALQRHVAAATVSKPPSKHGKSGFTKGDILEWRRTSDANPSAVAAGMMVSAGGSSLTAQDRVVATRLPGSTWTTVNAECSNNQLSAIPRRDSEPSLSSLFAPVPVQSHNDYNDGQQHEDDRRRRRCSKSVDVSWGALSQSQPQPQPQPQPSAQPQPHLQISAQPPTSSPTLKNGWTPFFDSSDPRVPFQGGQPYPLHNVNVKKKRLEWEAKAKAGGISAGARAGASARSTEPWSTPHLPFSATIGQGVPRRVT